VYLLITSFSKNNNTSNTYIMSSPLFILYGSATGNAEHIAKDLAAAYEKQSKETNSCCLFSSVICCELDQFKKKGQPIWDQAPSSQGKHGVIVVTSTTGNGDAPENAGRFVRFVKRKTTPSTRPFQHVAYAVLGLGDTNYDQFCACAVLCDKKMHECGGQRVQPLACADEATGLEDVVEPWKATVLAAMEKACFSSSSASNGNSNGATANEDAAIAPESTTIDKNNNKNMTVEEPTVTMRNTSKIEAPTTRIGDVDSSKEPADVDVDTTSEAMAAPTTTAENGKLLSTGVEIIRALMGINDNNNNLGSTMDSLDIDASLLPSLTASMSSCELLDKNPSNDDNDELQQQQQQYRPRGGSFSTVSSSGIHYTARKPYASTILAARYLTQTSTEAAQKVVATLTNHNNNTSSDGNSSTTNAAADYLLMLSWWKKSQEIYDDAFSLDNNSTNKNNQDDLVLATERNGKRVVELTLSLPDDDNTLEYEPGDSLGLLVENPAETVQFILEMLQRQQSESQQQAQQKQLISIDSGRPISVEQALRQEVDLASPIKSKRILYALSQHATDPQEQLALRLLSCKAKHGEELFTKYVEEQRRTVVDILREFPSTQGIPLTALISLLPSSIPPRYYSVASSPLATSFANGNKAKGLTIAFSVVDYMTPSMLLVGEKEVGRRRIRGIATRYLETLASLFLCQPHAAATSAVDGINGNSIHANTRVRIFPKPTAEFRLPTSLKTPLLLIGPGTGIAPFVGFLSHRRLQIQATQDAKAKAAQTIVEGTWRSGFELDEEDNLDLQQSPKQQSSKIVVDKKDVGPVHVFFGCRYANHDWIYKQEMQNFESLGIVEKLYTAFSRDIDAVERKKYVQDFLYHDQSCASRLAHLILHEDAAVYICGDGNKMAKDVQAAVVELLASGYSKEATNGGDIIPQTKEEAQKYLNKMKAEQRFLMDIWS
jgi:sulfite reductase alpha subunit-like flavoprotein